MSSELYQSFGNTAQSPREQAMSILRQRGITIPENISCNPSAIIQHLVQSGAVPQERLNNAQQMLSRMLPR